MDKTLLRRLDDIERRLNDIERRLDTLLLQQETVLTMSEAAEMMGVSNDMFRRIHTRVVPSYKAGRRIMFKKSDVLRALERFRRDDVQTDVVAVFGTDEGA